MDIFVAMGSTREPKLRDVEEALTAIFPLLHGAAGFKVEPMKVESGVRHTPLSRAETMAGARQRVEAMRGLARKSDIPYGYFIGLEGGIEIVAESSRRWAFLENWAYVTDFAGKDAFGQSGAVLLPQTLASEVIDKGVELADAIDVFAGSAGVRDAQGAWGVLTRDLITRKDSYRIALINAFAPFLLP
jgi:non-canonical (house-cleaning) NTP pyrophosphatase